MIRRIPARWMWSFHITEGQQIFVRNVLLTGLHFTRPDTVARAITVHPGDPLNQTALLETQRNLYEFALFNEVNLAVQNPNGGETYKTVLLQAVEARRWTLTYGAGFEAQTGTPQNNCRGLIANGAPCTPNGHTGISPRGAAQRDAQQPVRTRAVGLGAGDLRPARAEGELRLSESAFLWEPELRPHLQRRLRQQPGRHDLRGIAAGRGIPLHPDLHGARLGPVARQHLYL